MAGRRLAEAAPHVTLIAQESRPPPMVVSVSTGPTVGLVGGSHVVRGGRTVQRMAAATEAVATAPAPPGPFSRARKQVMASYMAAEAHRDRPFVGSTARDVPARPLLPRRRGLYSRVGKREHGQEHCTIATSGVPRDGHAVLAGAGRDGARNEIGGAYGVRSSNRSLALQRSRRG
jgi:hypothetical protein